jgi:threonine/homoserine/homoserine lactone efflux protein
LCIRRTLVHGRNKGLVTGLGAATADGLYGLTAALGLSVVTNFLLNPLINTLLRGGGGGFLIYLGITTMLTRPPKSNEANGTTENLSYRNAYLSTLALTLTNPATIITSAAIFAGLGFAERAIDVWAGAAMVGGVAIGSALWWLLLTGGVSLLHGRIGVRFMRVVNWVSGGVLAIFGLVAIYSLIG